MSRWKRATVLAGFGLAVIAMAAPSFAFTGQQYAKSAKVSIEQARALARKAVPGKITDEELEKESGGTGLRYSFDVALNGETHEVGIDARTGAVLENSIEGSNAD